jgi:serine/threonine protein kinase
VNLEQLSAGELIRDTYTIVRHLGSGAFGDVYLSRHRYMGLQALKVFPRKDGADALEEAYLLAKLSHPNIVRVFEANEFERGGEIYGYFSMEYVEGGTLLGIIDADLATDARIRLGKDILSGLAFAHSQVSPIIHRDISPTNILIDKSDARLCAKISDFGLAKHVDPQSLVASAGGKYLYMAPESFLGTHSTATDVYSAAIVLFELFTGRHPFRVALSASATASEIASVVRQSRSQAIPNVSDFCPNFGSRWDRFFQNALAHDYEERPRTAQDLLAQFVASTEPPPIPASTTATEDASAMVTEAKRLAEQADTLNDAIATLERACHLDPKIRDRYSEMLSLWRRGIVL